MGEIQEAIKQIALAYFKPIPQEHGILLETSCLYIKRYYSLQTLLQK